MEALLGGWNNRLSFKVYVINARRDFRAGNRVGLRAEARAIVISVTRETEDYRSCYEKSVDRNDFDWAADEICEVKHADRRESSAGMEW